MICMNVLARTERHRSMLIASVAVSALSLVGAHAIAGERYALIIAGASGGREYAEQHGHWIDALATMLVEQMKFDRATTTVLRDSESSSASTATNVRAAVASVRQRMKRDDLLFVVLIGHGTYDGLDAKFNLVGPDLESGQWAELFSGLSGRLVLVNTTAASFPFIERLRGDRRIVITATDSVAQRFDTVFPEQFVLAFQNEASDIDKNGRLSIWEAFAAAAAGVRRHYQERGQLATERPLLDDNGDGVGRDAAGSGDDGSASSRTYLDEPLPGAPPTDEVMLQLLQKRAALEAELDDLKIRKNFIPPDEYQKEFERLMIDLARVSRDIRARAKS
jgi:hypothetical protein